MTENITPYPFDELPQFNEDEVLSITSIARIFSGPGFSKRLPDEFKKLFQKHLGSDLNLTVESVFFQFGSKVKLSLPESFASFVLSFKNGSQSMMLIENHLAMAIADRMLGGNETILEASRELSPLEEGVMQYFTVNLIKSCNVHLPDSLHTTLSKMYTYPDELDAFWKDQAGFHIIQFKLQLKSVQGTIKLIIPQDILTEMNKDHQLFLGNISDQEYIEKRIENFFSINVLLWLEAGEVMLKKSELAELNLGDIILFDQSYPSYHGGRLKGDVLFKVGHGQNGGVTGEIDHQNDQEYILRVKESFI